MAERPEQTDGHAPLLEPALLVSENCPECRGTGYKVVLGNGDTVSPWLSADALSLDAPRKTTPCDRCEGAGREVREVPLSEVARMLHGAMQRYAPPSPSELRGRG